MNFKEYGDIIEGAKEPGSFKEFGEPVEHLSRTKSLVNAPIKGAVKRAGDIAGFFQSIAPFIPKGELTPESAQAYAEKLPTYEKEPERYLERAGGLGLEAALSGGRNLAVKGAQVLGGAALGYAAEKFNLPQWAQSIAEGLPFFYSGGKKIPLKSGQKRLGEFMRKEGLTENEITPLLKTPEQIDRWSKWATKGQKSRKLMDAVYEKSGKVYDNIASEAAKLPNGHVSQEAGMKFLKDVSGIVKDMPHKYRKLIEQDAKDLIKSGGHFNDFTNFYHDLNAVVGGERGGRAIVGKFKGPVLEAMESVSPKLTEDYRLANDLFRTRAKVKGALISPTEFDRFLDIGEGLALGQSVFNRDIGMMTKVLGATGARLLAREMLINPRLQNISLRIGEALKKNKYMVAEKLVKEFNKEAGDSNPELKDALSSLD